MNPAISASVEATVLRAMAVFPRDRFPSAAELASALGYTPPGSPPPTVATTQPAAAAPQPAAVPATATPVKRKISRWVWIALAFPLLCVGYLAIALQVGWWPVMVPKLEEVVTVIPPTEDVLSQLIFFATQTAEAQRQAPPFPTSGISESYVLQNGESPFCIARRFDVNPAELFSLNGYSMNAPISPGMVLKIPQTGNRFPGARALQPHPDTYTAQGGDTLNSIACRYGDVYPEAIAAVNGLQPPYSLTAGQQLAIP